MIGQTILAWPRPLRPANSQLIAGDDLQQAAAFELGKQAHLFLFRLSPAMADLRTALKIVQRRLKGCVVRAHDVRLARAVYQSQPGSTATGKIMGYMWRYRIAN